jgi:hypothetical protein
MPTRLTVVLVSLLLTTPAVIFCSYQNITAGVANSSFVLSLYTVPTVQSQTAINQHSFPVHFSGLPSKLFVHTYTTLAFARPTIVTHTGDVALFFSNFSFKPLRSKLETNLAACSVISKSYS